MDSASATPALRDAVRTWGYVGVNSFGGPAGQIAVMHRVVVDERRWVDEKRFLHALNFCMVLPGPEALQLAVYLGWVLNGVMGGLAAGALFVLPGLVVMAVLAGVYSSFGDVSWIAALLFGIQTAVIAIVVQAVVRLGRRSLRTPLLVALAVAAFFALALFDVLFPYVVVVGADHRLGSRTPEPGCVTRARGRRCRRRPRASGQGKVGTSSWIRSPRAVGRPVAHGDGRARDGEHLQPAGLALRQDRGPLFRRRIRRPLVRVAAGSVGTTAGSSPETWLRVWVSPRPRQDRLSS